jgi:MOSC domain-containing protein YiiM
MTDGRLMQINVSEGGVPKLPVPAARITVAGVEGDRQREVTVHGGPHRAVSLLGIEAIRRVAAEGHPIAPGTTGENLTTSGFDVSALAPGTRLSIGDEVVLELGMPANPCRTIRHSFADLRFGRLSAKVNAGDSRMYARVVREGVVRPGDSIRLQPPVDDRAERFEIADRLDAAERESAVAFWAAAIAAGHAIDVLDDGEIAVSAAPSLPGPIFNAAVGFAHLPMARQRSASSGAPRSVRGPRSSWRPPTCRRASARPGATWSPTSRSWRTTIGSWPSSTAGRWVPAASICTTASAGCGPDRCCRSTAGAASSAR